MEKTRLIKSTAIVSITVLLLLIGGVAYKSWNHVEAEYYSIAGDTHQLLYANGVYVCAPLDVTRNATIRIKHGSVCVIEGYGEFAVKRNKIYTLGESGIFEEEYSKERLDSILESL